METSNLSNVLKECQNSAQVGYQIASAQEKNLNRALSSAREEIRRTLADFHSSPCYSPEATELLERQLADIDRAFGQLSFAFKDDLTDLRANMSKFSITLFGRTMAGKSTLMEILTEGDGKTIGKGAQRTTRDVRRYVWNGLEITDVPGIGAFEGEDDEQIAFQAAKTADLILFLLTDDGPKAVEAEFFSRIVSLGKPIIGIINVKAAIPQGKSMKLVKWDVEKKFDLESLEEIRKQFLEYSECFEQSWDHIPFVAVHLQSAYLAQRAESQEQADLYYQISRISGLKSRISEQIRTKGEFYRVKTFIDIVSNPMLGAAEDLLEQSWVNRGQSRIILDKKRQLEEWKTMFDRDARKQIADFITELKGELDSRIAEFAEEHFEDKDADKAWNQYLKKQKIEGQCQELLEDLDLLLQNKCREISRELTNELNFEVSVGKGQVLKGKRIFDGKRAWNWFSNLAGGGLTIGSLIGNAMGLTWAGRLMKVGMAIGTISPVVSGLLKNRDKKESEARRKMEQSLRENLDTICGSLQEQMEENLTRLETARFQRLTQEMDKFQAVLFRLADTQRKLAWNLEGNLLELNRQMVAEAGKSTGGKGIRFSIPAVARISGNISLILLPEGTVFSQKQKESLADQMEERIEVVCGTGDKRTLISRVLQCDRELIRPEEDGVVHVSFEKETQSLRNRICLAQQLTGVQIING